GCSGLFAPIQVPPPLRILLPPPGPELPLKERCLCGYVNYPPLARAGFPAIIPLPTGSESTGSTALIRRLASAKCLILVAAFRSRSWVVPQSGHVHARSFSVRSAFR